MSTIIFPKILPKQPIQTSQKTHWHSISLEHHHQPPGETPEFYLKHCTIAIILTEDVYVERYVAGKYEHVVMHYGSISIVPPYVPHQHQWHKASDIFLLNLPLEMLTRNAQELLGSKSFHIKPCFNIHDPFILQVGLALKDELIHNNNSDKLYGDSMANALAVYLLRHYSEKPLNAERMLQGFSQDQLKVVISYINDNLESEISLCDLAALIQTSQSYFSRTFKQFMGLSPYQYVIHQRVEHAKQLLKQGNMSISDIAFACGFTHQSHLHRHFKRLVNSTPREFMDLSSN